MVSSYIAQYPIIQIAQSTLHFTPSSWQTTVYNQVLSLTAK